MRPLIAAIGEEFSQNRKFSDTVSNVARKGVNLVRTWSGVAKVGVYSAVLHYLQGVAAAGSDDRDAIAKKMRELPVHDQMVPNGRVREDGIVLHDILLLQAKKPEEPKGEWDLFKILKASPGEQAFRPIQQGNCPYLKGR